MVIRDWSSDVCSSDLAAVDPADRHGGGRRPARRRAGRSSDLGGARRAARRRRRSAGGTSRRRRRRIGRRHMDQLLLTLIFLGVLFFLLGSGVWVGLSLLGVALVGMELFTSRPVGDAMRSEEHTSELQSLMRISYAVFCLK